MTRRASSSWWVLAATAALGLVTPGCSEGDTDDDTSSSSSTGDPTGPSTGPGAGYISDNPNATGSDEESGGDNDGSAVGAGTGSGAGEDDGGGTGGGASAPDDPGFEEQDPERVIAEADIIQVHGGRLYALSAYSGLSIIDIGGDRLKMLGRKALGGTPFEMYLVDGIVYAMFSEWGKYIEHDDGSWEWVNTSHLEALDVTDASDIATVGSFELPGWIADSRMVGDVIYTVTFEDGYCWECKDGPQTTITSLSVGQADDIGVVDRLTIEEPAETYGWSRSVSVVEDRMYIAGVDWWDGTGSSSTIQVVDISDPGGDLKNGTTVEISGQVQSRWQMDEHEGVLRVISQPWDSSINPKIETFTVESATSITPLGSGEIIIPQPEQLMAARFDGDRAYAITAVQTDPLFTIDLSDPANPVQKGELELPGFIWHIEPRGDRLLTLGFDQASSEGSLHVSLYDVSDMENPTEIRRIPFGGDWSNLAEDQNRIHKAFKIDAENELIAVPYTAWDYDDYGCGGYESGVQLIDWKDDDLTRRGVAEIRGQARRAFMAEDRFFAISDEQVRTFDIADRDEPLKTAELQLSTHVSRVVIDGGNVVRLSSDWWTSEPRLEIVSADAPDSADPIGSVDLGAMLAEAENDQSCYGWSYWDTRLFAHGGDIYVVWPSWNGDTARLAVVDASDPTQPRVASHMDIPVDTYSYYGWYYYGGGYLVSDGQPVVQTGSTLSFLEVEQPYYDGYYGYESDPGAQHAAHLRVVDLADADQPRVSARVTLPSGAGHTKLVAHGSTVMLSHWEPLLDDPSKARFYLDRVDVSDPAAPALLPKVNVPGSLVSFDAQSNHLLTVDYEREVVSGVTYEECYERFGYGAMFESTELDDPFPWNDDVGTCSYLHRTLRLTAVDDATSTATMLDGRTLPDNMYFNQLFVGDDRVFATTQGYGESYDEDGNYVPPESLVWAIGGLRDGDLTITTKSLEDVWWAYPVAADGKRLVAMAYDSYYAGTSLLSIDSTNLDALEVKKHDDLPWWVQSVTIDGDRALCSLGAYGLSVVDLK